MVVYFQVTDGWMYLLFDDGQMARRSIATADSVWEEVELPEFLVKPIQKNQNFNARVEDQAVL